MRPTTYLCRLPALALAASLPAQGTFVVSPASLQSSAGNQALNVIEPTSGRWQQIHGDLLGAPRLIRGFRLRRDETVPVLPIATPQVVIVEVFMGEVDFASVSSDFAANLGPAAVAVLPGSALQLPDWVGGVSSPASFDLEVALAVPFPYSGTKALVVEVRTLLGDITHIADAYGEEGNESPSVSLGQGCSAGLLPYIQNSSLTTMYGPGLQPLLRWNLSAFSSPIGLPGVFVVGNQTSPLNLPGQCGTLWPTIDLIVPAFQTVAGPIAVNQAGDIVTPFPVSVIGATFTTQAVSFDFSPGGVGYLLSQGQELTIAPLPALPEPVLSLRGSVSDPLGSQVVFGGRVLEFEN